jgi:sugar O-acyltransferase (sialic acid O-acetyltransferase NeuD family)
MRSEKAEDERYFFPLAGEVYMKNIAIIGDAGFAREVFFLINKINKTNRMWVVSAFLVAKVDESRSIFGVPVLEESQVAGIKDLYAISGMGSPTIKRQVVRKIIEYCPTIRFATLVHPNADVGLDPAFGDQAVQIGDGTIIAAGNIVTVNIKVGKHVHLNLDCTIGHDARIDDYATLSPGVHVSGNVHIGAGAYIGTGASIIEGVTIGEGSVVGAAACVVRDVPPFTLAIGVPAKFVKDLPRPE